MTLPLTPDTLRAAYDFLATTPPFNKWNLPDGDDITFRVAKDRTLFGWHDKRRGKPHLIAISEYLVGQITTLMETMSHEMIHLHEERSCIRGNHGPAFKKFAEQVCKIHTCFDRKRF